MFFPAKSKRGQESTSFLRVSMAHAAGWKAFSESHGHGEAGLQTTFRLGMIMPSFPFGWTCQLHKLILLGHDASLKARHHMHIDPEARYLRISNDSVEGRMKSGSKRQWIVGTLGWIAWGVPNTLNTTLPSPTPSLSDTTMIDYQNYSTSHLKVMVIAVSALPRTFTFTVRSLTFAALSEPHLPYQTHQLYQFQYLKNVTGFVDSVK